ncbi:histone-lysine N-methyltransferase PRDM9-like isoform X4 [Frankliniella occidentalis]|uniref:Histone-lysine N-methyltransferase PRDM9-like isoform X4 n=1 Tax=Frankliniella occidentalis TaxID=133901 RepID=A0A9C6WRH5_FRAOC|nr:histone-lysine N-methyltransferase PRDM9-like isoform X4 [Frankliniella occidentalis]
MMSKQQPKKDNAVPVVSTRTRSTSASRTTRKNKREATSASTAAPEAPPAPRDPKSGVTRSTEPVLQDDEDDVIFCDDCQKDWPGDCPEHGPLLVIADTEVAVGRPDRALLTVPPQLVVLVSKIPGAGLGVWTRQAVPRRVRFGPYEGDTVPADQETGYGWEIYRAGKPTHCVDALDVTSSNWLRFVNCARHSGEQNLFPYQYKGKLYYRTTHDIPANTELLVWYGDSYAKDLGVDPEAYEDPAQLDQRALTGTFPCERCNLCFVSPLLLAQHHRCGACSAEIRRRRACAAPSGAVGGELGDGAAVASGGGDQGAAVPDKPHRCETCGAAFKREDDLQRHIRTHSAGAFLCERCNLCFVSPLLLAQHHRCGACPAEMKRRQRRRACATPGGVVGGELGDGAAAAAAAVAAGEDQGAAVLEKPHRCPTCAAAFKRKGDLQRHIRTHTGEKPHSCRICGAGFAQRGNLLTHMMIHTGEKLYGCQTCGAAFAESGHLRQHMRTHTGEKPYSCQTCGASFAESGDLRRHVRTHTGEKPYTCETCGAAFAQSGNLRKHMRTHTGEKPYVCQTCSASFAESGHLRNHMRTHTGKKSI